jgi:hypothetical protein
LPILNRYADCKHPFNIFAKYRAKVRGFRAQQQAAMGRLIQSIFKRIKVNFALYSHII